MEVLRKGVSNTRLDWTKCECSLQHIARLDFWMVFQRMQMPQIWPYHRMARVYPRSQSIRLVLQYASLGYPLRITTGYHLENARKQTLELVKWKGSEFIVAVLWYGDHELTMKIKHRIDFPLSWLMQFFHPRSLTLWCFFFHSSKCHPSSSLQLVTFIILLEPFCLVQTIVLCMKSGTIHFCTNQWLCEFIWHKS